MCQETDNTNVSHDVNVPVLILSGGKDTVISPEMHALLVAAFPDAQRVEIPKAGHASYAEYPDIFNEQIKEFATKARR